MSKVDDLCTCSRCGHTWTRGRHGGHSCAENLQYKLCKLSHSLSVLSADMHLPSRRPCETCKSVTLLVGFNFGCYAYQEKLQKRAEQASQ